jgi:hypothetical protein
MRMRVCYLECHEAGLCCNLSVHIENLLRPLQLFYFRLWRIYWLFLVLYDLTIRSTCHQRFYTFLKTVRFRHGLPIFRTNFAFLKVVLSPPSVQRRVRLPRIRVMDCLSFSCRMVGLQTNWKELERKRPWPNRGTIPEFVSNNWEKSWNISVKIDGMSTEVRN